MAEDAVQPDLQHRVTTIVWACLNAELLVVLVWGSCRMFDTVVLLGTQSVCLALLLGCVLGVLWCISTALYREWFARRPSSESHWLRAAEGDDGRRARASVIQALATAVISLAYLAFLNWPIGVVGAVATAMVWLSRSALLRRAPAVAAKWLTEALSSAVAFLALAVCAWCVFLCVVWGNLTMWTAIQAIALSAVAVVEVSACTRFEPPSRSDGNAASAADTP